MTPSEYQPRDHKTLPPNGSSTAETKSGKTDDSDRTDDVDVGDETVLLPAFWYGAIVYHAIDPADDTDEPEPLCGSAGTYQRVSLADAREHADRRCNTRRCRAPSLSPLR